MSEKIVFNLKDKINKLEEIVAWFDSDQDDVEMAIEQYQIGLKLIEDINQYLKTAKIKVEKINQRFDIE